MCSSHAILIIKHNMYTILSKSGSSVPCRFFQIWKHRNFQKALNLLAGLLCHTSLYCLSFATSSSPSFICSEITYNMSISKWAGQKGTKTIAAKKTYHKTSNYKHRKNKWKMLLKTSQIIREMNTFNTAGKTIARELKSTVTRKYIV